MLEHSVDGLTELINFKTTAAQLQVTTGTVISYDGYVSLLYGAAQMYYTQLSSLTPPNVTSYHLNHNKHGIN